MKLSRLHINSDRLKQDIRDLARFGASEDGGIYRMAFTDADMAARAWLRHRIEDAGLTAYQDGAANVFGRLNDDSSNPAILMGSHLDTVPAGGHLDGGLGVMVALECLRRIHEAGLKPRYPLEMVAFSDEEGRFGPPLGSRALAGDLSQDDLEQAVDLDGVSLGAAMALHQLNIYQMLLARREPGSLHAYLEIHIEQGPVLEERQCPVGIVEAFAGLFKWTIRFTGQPDHAGTTPMPMRRDALGGLTEFAAGIPLILYSEGSEDSVATIGKVDLFPGTANTVPGQAEFSLDVRDPDARVLEALEQAFREALMKIAQRRKLDVECDILSTIPPVACDQEIIERITRAAEALQTPYHAMQSGAIHDAQILSRLTRVGMIFVPSKGGRSHSPEEWTRWEDIEVGANVALHTLLALADIPTPEPENQTA